MSTLKISPRSRTEKELTNYIWTIWLQDHCDWSILSSFEVSDQFLASWTQFVAWPGLARILIDNSALTQSVDWWKAVGVKFTSITRFSPISVRCQSAVAHMRIRTHSRRRAAAAVKWCLWHSSRAWHAIFNECTALPTFSF